MVATTIAMMSEAISAIIPIIMSTANIRAVMGGFIILTDTPQGLSNSTATGAECTENSCQKERYPTQDHPHT